MAKIARCVGEAVWRRGAERIQLGGSGTSKQVRVRKPFEP